MRRHLATLAVLIGTASATQATTPDQIAAGLCQALPMVLGSAYDLYDAQSVNGALVLTVFRTADASVTQSPPHELAAVFSPFACAFWAEPTSLPAEAPLVIDLRDTGGGRAVRLDFGYVGCGAPPPGGTQSLMQVPQGNP